MRSCSRSNLLTAAASLLASAALSVACFSLKLLYSSVIALSCSDTFLFSVVASSNASIRSFCSNSNVLTASFASSTSANASVLTVARASRSVINLSLAIALAASHICAPKDCKRSVISLGSSTCCSSCSSCCSRFQLCIASDIVVNEPPPKAVRTLAKVGLTPSAFRRSAVL